MKLPFWFAALLTTALSAADPARPVRTEPASLPVAMPAADPGIGIKFNPPPDPSPSPETAEPTAPDESPAPPEFPPRPPENLLEAQIELSRRGFSSGPLDGVFGRQTEAALKAFQETMDLTVTGQLDHATRAALPLSSAPLATYTVTPEDFARLQPLGTTWVGKSEQTALDYENILELVAERFHANPKLIRRLNPNVNWDTLFAGEPLTVPAVARPKPAVKAAHLHVRLEERVLQARDEGGRIIAHFPVSIASKVEKRPVGELHITVVIPNPDYTFDPVNFPESEEAQTLTRRLILAPGPNNPVGLAWIGLDRPGYGIHGTPVPEHVGRTESHGCFRLANWDALTLLDLVAVGLPVFVDP